MEMNQVAAISTSSTTQEGVNEETEGSQEQANYIGNSHRQNHDPYSKTYNPGWRNHPNFGWENQQDQSLDQRRPNPNNAAHQHFTSRPYQHFHNNTSPHPHQNQNNLPHSSTSDPNLQSLDDRLSKIENLLEGIGKEIQDSKAFREEVMSNTQNQDTAIKKLETQIGYLFKQIPSHNLRSKTNSTQREECQAITLRSGKELKETSQKPQEEDSNKEEEEQDEARVSTLSSQKGEGVLKPDAPRVPYPQQLKKKGDDNQFSRFLEIFKKLQINIPFAEAIEQMPLYAKFLKELMTKKRIWKNNETVILTEECSAIIQHKLPQKLKDPGSFQIPCIIGEITVEKALCDLGASINLMSVAMMRKMKIEEAKPTKMALQLADRSFKFPHGVVEDLLVKLGDFIFPVDFVVLDMQEEAKTSIILGRPFLATAGAVIDVQKGDLILRLHNKKITINVFKAMSYPQEQMGKCVRLDSLEEEVQESFEEEESEEPERIIEEEFTSSEEVATTKMGIPGAPKEENEKSEAPKLELKALPPTLKYAYLGENKNYPVIISSYLSQDQEDELLKVLRKHKDAIGWTLANLKGISSAIYMHKILLEDDAKPSIQSQRRLNPIMKEVVQKEVMKLWQGGVVYPISNSPWVSPVHVVPKKGGITVVPNERNELIPTRTVTGWRMCIDYRKLNEATRKDHFPLPFMDKMLERLAGHAYYCFLDGYSGYNQIVVDPRDQEKTSFTCPYGVFAYRRMPFGLCNAPVTFQRCMLSIFSDMIEKFIEVFMDDFSVFGDSFPSCLHHLALVLKRCQETNLVLN
ncbi:hypothetical protein AHAS_Ahas12G0123600 [Arachis hypogaea]